MYLRASFKSPSQLGGGGRFAAQVAEWHLVRPRFLPLYLFLFFFWMDEWMDGIG